VASTGPSASAASTGPPAVELDRERAEPAEPVPVNVVHLAGRLAAEAAERTLPSGDTVSTFRLVVGRPPPSRAGSPSVDTLDCAAWSARQRRRLAPLPAGTVLEVRGALRRRFFRAGGAVASRYEVEVEDITVLARPPRAAAPGPPRRRAAAAPDPSPASA